MIPKITILGTGGAYLNSPVKIESTSWTPDLYMIASSRRASRTSAVCSSVLGSRWCTIRWKIGLRLTAAPSYLITRAFPRERFLQNDLSGLYNTVTCNHVQKLQLRDGVGPEQMTSGISCVHRRYYVTVVCGYGMGKLECWNGMQHSLGIHTTRQNHSCCNV